MVGTPAPPARSRGRLHQNARKVRRYVDRAVSERCGCTLKMRWMFPARDPPTSGSTAARFLGAAGEQRCNVVGVGGLRGVHRAHLTAVTATRCCRNRSADGARVGALRRDTTSSPLPSPAADPPARPASPAQPVGHGVAGRHPGPAGRARNGLRLDDRQRGSHRGGRSSQLSPGLHAGQDRAYGAVCTARPRRVILGGSNPGPAGLSSFSKRARGQAICTTAP